MMQKDGHSLNTFCLTTAIAACAACGKTDEALALLAHMRDKGLECTVFTYNAAMFACAKTGRWRDALNVFEVMRSHISQGGSADQRLFIGAIDNRPARDESADELFAMTEEDGRRVMQSTLLDLSAVSEEVMEATEDTEEYESSYMESFNIANIVTYNTLIEALGEGGQFMLVDDVYQDAVSKGIVNPLRDFKTRGWVDLHFHSVHMGNAALRYLFEAMIDDEALLNGQGDLVTDITIIIGKGGRLQKAIQTQLRNDFRPAIRSSVLNKNIGRLSLSPKDVGFWLRTHRSLRGAMASSGTQE
jgi:pentatricopeptide repeat protein